MQPAVWPASSRRQTAAAGRDPAPPGADGAAKRVRRNTREAAASAATTTTNQERLTIGRKRTENHAKDPYQLIESPHFGGYADRLKCLGAFDNLDNQDARHVAGVIITDQTRFGPHGWPDGIREPRDVRLALKQRAANVGTGCDVRKWHDHSAASRALGMAADAVG